MKISVLGEAIIDLIPKNKMSYNPTVGGSPFNFARAISRAGLNAFYLSPISNDGLGDLIIEQAKKDNIQFSLLNRSPFPTSLAVVSYIEQQPQYSLYRQGVADVMFDCQLLRNFFPDDTTLFHTGSLMLVPTVIDEVAEFIKLIKAEGVFISLDLNLRPNVTKDKELYIQKILSLLPFADIVKASDEDLEYMGLDIENNEEDFNCYFKELMLVYTKGSEGSHVFNAGKKVSCRAMPVTKFKDAIGAGDTFFGYFIATLIECSQDKQEWDDESVLLTALMRASTAAAMNVEETGCKPPIFADVISRLEANTVNLKY